MKKAHSILQKDYPNIIFLGCFTHNINLLIKSIIELALIKEIITPNVVFEECIRKSILSSLNSKLIDTERFNY
ncbi:hypothetical protein RhiirA4_493176 [Rhizophagus irregularis]|uniref:DUF659 domain-containing protein n=1 Tax=Rhizophagus irregularis TaxID=588596 RepID=A0A2I1HXI4_9GLOM|nr:hypothetical protein RhiirA4_493176 [Rhizophagus irregularis]